MSIVYPSGAARATRPTAMLPPAPPTFSITTVWPSGARMRSPRMRAAVSVEPPGGKGTISVIGRKGQVCACAPVNTAARANAIATRCVFKACSSSSPLLRIIVHAARGALSIWRSALWLPVMLETLERQSAGSRIPVLKPENLGDESFRRDHRLRYAYVAGAMANGIASTRLVAAMAGAGMLSFFGAAGLGLDRIEAAIDELARAVPGAPYGFNLIHSPNEPELEAQVVDLYLRRGVRLVEASAYLRLTLPVVRYRVSGIARNAAGHIVAPNRIIAKVSRVEVATQFFSPPPQEFLDQLLRAGEISTAQAALAK